jgi:hypothetical protein
MRYAYFPDSRRLVFSRGGAMEILDTGEHTIYGFGQQQGGNDGITLNSQFGTVPLSSLRRVQAEGHSAPAHAPEPTPAAEDAAFEARQDASFAAASPFAPHAEDRPAPQTAATERPQPRDLPTDAGTILSLVEKLGELRDKGVLSEEEFASKKTELLKRL